MSLERRLEVDMSGVLGMTGIALVVMGLAQWVPALVALSTRGPAPELFLGGLGTAATGYILAPLRHRARKWTRREALAIVALSWLAAIAAAAVPYVAVGASGPIDALVESASGLTTTGATVFPDVDHLGRDGANPASEVPAWAPALYMWRALTHWIGGAGIVLMVLVLAPALGDEGDALRRTQRAEANFLTERYRGSTKATLKGLMVVYGGATLVLTLLLVALGLSLWDAVLHAFATISTGGFSNYTSSLGTWGNAVQLVVVVFMLLGALNFAVLGKAMDELLAIKRRRTRHHGKLAGWLALGRAALPVSVGTLWRHGEIRGYLLLLTSVTASLTLVLFLQGDPGRYHDQGPQGLGQAFVDTAFMVTSISTTTGFGAQDYETWPAACQLVLLGLMLVGGCSGSTAGGLKFRRLQLAFHFVRREIRRFPRPRAVIPIKIAGVPVPEAQVREALGYIATYVLLVLGLGIVIALSGVDPASAGAASVSSFGSIGPGFGACGPSGSFQPYAPWVKLLCVLAMLLGRLEIFTPLSVFMPSYWLRRGRVPH